MPSTVYSTLILLSYVTTTLSTIGNDILRLNIPTEPNLDPNIVCKTFPSLTQKQYELCSRYPDVVASAIQGIQIALHECRFQFKDHRWNCSTLETKNKNPYSSPFLAKGFREVAFAYAVASAGVTHQVAKACALGKLTSCGCDTRIQGPSRAKRWEWGGCSHNVDFGDTFTHQFLDSKEKKSKDMQSQINIHNNRAGRMVVTRHVRTRCKCHGMSGSCELKTCWKATPDFREVGNMLKDKYHMATKVDATNSVKGRLIPLSRGYNGHRRRALRTDLVYFEKSPTYCDASESVDTPGTRGRICNRTSTGIDNCETLCCGRGYDTVRMRRTEKCRCKFHWCCYVVCDTCSYNDWVTVCK